MKSETLYGRVVDALARVDPSGHLLGRAIASPRYREAARRLAHSTSTIVEAYGQLLDRGLIESRPQSGYYVRRDVRAVPGDARYLAPSSQSGRRYLSAPSRWRLVHAMSDPRVVAFGSAVPHSRARCTTRDAALGGRRGAVFRNASPRL